MKWSCDFQKVGAGIQVATFLTLFWLDEEPESEKVEVELFCFDMLFMKKSMTVHQISYELI